MVEDPFALTRVGSSPIGGRDHVRLLMVTGEAGVEDVQEIRRVQFDGGTDAVTQMMGGQVDVVSTDISKIGGLVDSGDIRLLGVMSDERVPAFSDAPTMKAQGIDMTGHDWRGLYAEGDVSDEAYEAWVDDLLTLYASEAWQTAVVEFGLVSIRRGGGDFGARIRERKDVTAQISRDIGVIR